MWSRCATSTGPTGIPTVEAAAAFLAVLLLF